MVGLVASNRALICSQVKVVWASRLERPLFTSPPAKRRNLTFAFIHLLVRQKIRRKHSLYETFRGVLHRERRHEAKRATRAPYACAQASGGARPRKRQANHPTAGGTFAGATSKSETNAVNNTNGAEARPCSGSSTGGEKAAPWIWLRSKVGDWGAGAVQISAKRRRSSLAETTGNKATAATNTDIPRR